ncbi:redoxin domain-containing protein [Bacillaceae bacterium IKA-2]|nr:redoxin domain-containing protein [Bacillaceae bacterium IKA-2]
MPSRRFTSLIIFLVAVGFIGYVLVTTESGKVGAEVGKNAPDFNLPLWHNGEFAELSSFRGDIVVLNLWASWCPPCKKEMPDLIRFSNDYQDKGVKVVGVNLATHERAADGADEFMVEYGVEFPTFIDQPGEDRRGIVSSLYNINSIPYTYILDQDGRISKIISGEVTYEMLVEFIEELR